MLSTWQTGDISNNEIFKGDFVAAQGAIMPKAIVMPASTDLYFPPERQRARGQAHTQGHALGRQDRLGPLRRRIRHQPGGHRRAQSSAKVAAVERKQTGWRLAATNDRRAWPRARRNTITSAGRA